MCVLMSHMRFHFKMTTCFGQEESWEPPKCILAVFSGIAPITCSCSRTRVFQLDGRPNAWHTSQTIKGKNFCFDSELLSAQTDNNRKLLMWINSFQIHCWNSHYAPLWKSAFLLLTVPNWNQRSMEIVKYSALAVCNVSKGATLA